MIILIDAYNLLKTILHTQFIHNTERIKFLALFERYARLSNNEIIIVFDGENEDYEYEKIYSHIQVYYSGYKQTADDVIKIKLKSSQGLDILLVTLDRELRQYAEQCKIESIGVVEFYEILKNVMKQYEKKEIIISQAIHKSSIDDNIEVDALMEFGSRKLISKEQDKDMRVGSFYKDKKYSSKKYKKLFKKIVKI